MLVSIFRRRDPADLAEHLGKILPIQRVAHQLRQTADLHARLVLQQPLCLGDAAVFQIARKTRAGHQGEDAPQVIFAHEQPFLCDGLQAELRLREVFVNGKEELPAAGVRLGQVPRSGQGICPPGKGIFRGGLALKQQFPRQFAKLLPLLRPVVPDLHLRKRQSQLLQQFFVAARLPQAAKIENFIHGLRQGRVPAGVYMTGSLRLHSNMELYLDEGAVLQGTAEPEDYLPRIPSRFEGTEMECYSSLLNLGTLDHTAGPNCENIILRGKGTIASGGRLLASRIIENERARLKEYLAQNADLVSTCENADTIPGRVRPRLVNMSNCRNIWMQGLTFANGASWNLHMVYSDQIVTDHCVIKSDGVWNGDGWDPDSSTNCTIFACEFCTGDDAVAIKSGKNPEGNIINRPTKHIRVFDCHSGFGHGICIGSEMSGGVEAVKIWDCDMAVSTSGLEIKATQKRGGYVRDVEVRDCTLSHVMVHSVGYNDDGIGSDVPPILENFRYERVTLLGRYIDHDHVWHFCPAIELCGFDEPGYEVKNIRFRDVVLEDNNGPAQNIQMQHCQNVSFENVTVRSGSQPE